MLHFPLPHTMLPFGAVQAEWANTLDRVQQLCPVIRAAEVVRPERFAYIEIGMEHQDLVDTIERILFQNLLLRPLQRVEDRGTIEFQADWLWNWRQSVPWSCERSTLARLLPDAPERSYVYGYSLVLVEG
ncbi:MAG: hypothetical protein JNM62_03785 [Flavobacteriales bacterium]|nr:hypothetical protein [Flavobacteriales bacterium]